MHEFEYCIRPVLSLRRKRSPPLLPRLTGFTRLLHRRNHWKTSDEILTGQLLHRREVEVTQPLMPAPCLGLPTWHQACRR
jgi:hypothetical protein